MQNKSVFISNFPLFKGFPRKLNNLEIYSEKKSVLITNMFTDFVVNKLFTDFFRKINSTLLKNPHIFFTVQNRDNALSSPIKNENFMKEIGLQQGKDEY